MKMNDVYSPNQHVVDYLNGAKSRAEIARTIRNFRRLIQGHPRGRSVDYAGIDALIALRKSLPGGQFSSYDQISESGAMPAHDLLVLTQATRDENRVLLLNEIASRPAIRLGSNYKISLSNFPFPDFELLYHSYFERQYYGLPEYSVIPKYSTYLQGPGGILVGMSFYDIKLQGLQVQSAVLGFGLTYDHAPGNYRMVFVHADGNIEQADLSLEVEFKPYIIDLGDQDVFAIRSGFAKAKPVGAELDSDNEYYVRQVLLLTGKRNEDTPKQSKSLLRGFLPRAVVPSNLMIALPAKGSTGVDFMTDVRSVSFFGNRETVVGISGKSQDLPDKRLRPRIRFYEQNNEVVELQDKTGARFQELVLQAKVSTSTTRVDADLGGFLTKGAVSAAFPQVSFLQTDTQKVEETSVYFFGPYHKKGRNPSDKLLQLREVKVITARAGDTIERSMPFFGALDGIADGRDLLVLFNKALVQAYDFQDLEKTPIMAIQNQVSDPNGKDSLDFTPEKDVLNPGLDFDTEPITGKIITKSKDTGPRSATQSSPADTHVGGRRYGLVFLYPRISPSQETFRSSFLTIAHSLPRGSADDGGAQVPGYKGVNVNPKTGVAFGVPAQATVTVYPPLGLESNGFLRSMWKFDNTGAVPVTNRTSNGNETFLYRHFRECFRKGAEKAPDKLKRDFFNGKGLQGGTPPLAIGNFGTQRPIFFISEVPFLKVIPTRTFLIDSKDGATLLTLENVVALEMFTWGNAYMLLALRRTMPVGEISVTKDSIIDYFKDFELAGYQLRTNQEGDDITANVALLSTEFGKEQPFLMSFNELDPEAIPSNIGVQGTEAHLIAPKVRIQEEEFLLTASPIGTDGEAVFHLYAPIVDPEGVLSLEKRISNIQMPAGKCKLLRLTQNLQAHIPLIQAPVQSYYGSVNTFRNDTIFIVEQSTTNETGQPVRRLLFCKVGKDSNGRFALIPGDLITDLSNYS